jgi:hypothetical protein
MVSKAAMTKIVRWDLPANFLIREIITNTDTGNADQAALPRIASNSQRELKDFERRQVGGFS